MTALREVVMTSGSKDDEERLWSDARRQAALQEIEEQFHLHLSEEEVFRAATLFFALLSEYSLIDTNAAAQRMRSELTLGQEE